MTSTLDRATFVQRMSEAPGMFKQLVFIGIAVLLVGAILNFLWWRARKQHQDDPALRLTLEGLAAVFTMLGSGLIGAGFGIYYFIHFIAYG